MHRNAARTRGPAMPPICTNRPPPSVTPTPRSPPSQYRTPRTPPTIGLPKTFGVTSET